MYLGDVFQQHSEESPGQRTWKGSSGLGCLWLGVYLVCCWQMLDEVCRLCKTGWL